MTTFRSMGDGRSEGIGGTPDPGTGLSIHELTAWHGPRKILERITLEVPARRVTAIIGPSGSGKSTLLRCVNRLHELTPDARVEGAVRVGGHDVYARAASPMLVRRHIGMVFQRPNILPSRSIFENVAVGPRLLGGSSRGVSDVVEQSLRQAFLWDEVENRLRAPAANLSGGQQQRLCIARALAVQPQVILMDEPCSALDPTATYRIEELIGELKRTYTVLIVTHNLQQASRVSDFTAFLLADQDYVGRLVECGPTTKIFTSPTERRTEEYITGRFG